MGGVGGGGRRGVAVRGGGGGGGGASQPMRSEKTYPSGTLPNQHSVLLQLLEDIGRPAEGNSRCFRPARGEKVFFGLLSMS